MGDLREDEPGAGPQVQVHRAGRVLRVARAAATAQLRALPELSKGCPQEAGEELPREEAAPARRGSVLDVDLKATAGLFRALRDLGALPLDLDRQLPADLLVARVLDLEAPALEVEQPVLK